jgi:hypothetical protein
MAQAKLSSLQILKTMKTSLLRNTSEAGKQFKHDAAASDPRKKPGSKKTTPPAPAPSSGGCQEQQPDDANAPGTSCSARCRVPSTLLEKYDQMVWRHSWCLARLPSNSYGNAYFHCHWPHLTEKLNCLDCVLLYLQTSALFMKPRLSPVLAGKRVSINSLEAINGSMCFLAGLMWTIFQRLCMDDSHCQEGTAKTVLAPGATEVHSPMQPEQIPRPEPAAGAAAGNCSAPLDLSTFLDYQALAQYEAQFCSSDCSLAGVATRQQRSLLSMLQQVAPRGVWPIEPDLTPLVPLGKKQQQQQVNSEVDQKQTKQLWMADVREEEHQMDSVEEQQPKQQHGAGLLHQEQLQKDQQNGAKQQQLNVPDGPQGQAYLSQEPQQAGVQKQQQQNLIEELSHHMEFQLHADDDAGAAAAAAASDGADHSPAVPRASVPQAPGAGAAPSNPFRLASYLAMAVTVPSSGIDLLLGAAPEEELDHEDVPLPSYLQKYLAGAGTGKGKRGE